MTADVQGRGGVTSYAVQNISTGGMLLTGARAPARGTLEITLRQSGTRSVQLTGHVVHELPEGIGVAFEPMSTAVAEGMEKLIASVDARNNQPPPLPPGRASAPGSPAVLRSTEDPFASGPDPRPPRLGSPDERSEYLRILVKKRDEAIQKGRTMYEAVLAEADQLRADAAKLKSKLDAALGQVVLGEAALAASRTAVEKEAAARQLERAEDAAALKLERATSTEMLEQEQRRTLEAIAAVAGLEAKLRRFENEAAHARADAEAARKEANEVVADTAALRRSREELVAANRKAMEAQTALNKERAIRSAAEAPIAEARAAQQAAEAETKKVTAELARLKAKLITAENALERSATRKQPDLHRR